MTLIQPTDCPYYLITRAGLLITSFLKKGFSDAGFEQVRPAYLGVLMSLWREDCLKVVELGHRAGLEPSTMTGLLDRMERDGVVGRHPDPHDRRVQRICLTKAGKQAQEPVLKVVDQVLGEVFSGISENDISNTKNLLRHILENADKRN